MKSLVTYLQKVNAQTQTAIQKKWQLQNEQARENSNFHYCQRQLKTAPFPLGHWSFVLGGCLWLPFFCFLNGFNSTNCLHPSPFCSGQSSLTLGCGLCFLSFMSVLLLYSAWCCLLPLDSTVLSCSRNLPFLLQSSLYAFSNE